MPGLYRAARVCWQQCWRSTLEVEMAHKPMDQPEVSGDPSPHEVIDHIVGRAAWAAHSINNIYRKALGEPEKPEWGMCDRDLRASVISGVRGILVGNTPEQSHQGWLDFKRAQGWIFGHREDAAAKTHPCMVPYDELPESQRLKDTIFHAVVKGVLTKHGLLSE